jgi:hypothetical protein
MLALPSVLSVEAMWGFIPSQLPSAASQSNYNHWWIPNDSQARQLPFFTDLLTSELSTACLSLRL